MARSKKKNPHKTRDLVILGMILAHKGRGNNTRMRDKRERRLKDARRTKEEYA